MGENLKTLNVYIVIFFMIFLNSILAQNADSGKNKKNVQTGFLTEVSLVGNTKDYVSKGKKTEYNMFFYPISLYLSGRAYFTNNIYFEFRPGIIYGGEYFSGLEYGVYLRYYFKDSKYYIIGGVNFHDNLGDAHGTTHFVSISDDIVTLVNLSVGYKINSHFGVLLEYNHSFENYKIYREINVTSIINSDAIIYDAYLENIIKLGIDYTF